MSAKLPDEALDLLFRKARTHSAWLDKPVTDDTIHQIYELMKWGPTSANSCPARFFFIRSPEAKQRLKRALHHSGMRKLFAENPQLVESTARRNSSLQGAYFIMAARALGLDCGPMSGFDNAALDEEFFGAGKQCKGGEQEFFSEGQLKSNFLCNLGYGDATKLYPRNPRLTFEEACCLL